jgi:hypothetical protein
VFHPWCKKIDKEDYFGQYSGDALTPAWLGKEDSDKDLYIQQQQNLHQLSGKRM